MRVAIIDPSCFSMPYDHSLCEGLVHQGCKVFFLGSQSQHVSWDLPESYERWNKFYPITYWLYGTQIEKPKFFKGIEHVVGMERLVHCLREWKPDIIHFQWLPLPSIDRLFLSRLRKIAPLVLTVHNTEPFHGSPSSKLQLWGYSAALCLFDHYIVHTEFSRSKLIENYIVPSSQISIIPHGVLDYYKTVKKNHHQQISGSQIMNSPKNILFFGLIKPYKGLDLLIEAFSLLPKKLQNNSQLLIVGHTRIPIGNLQKLAETFGVSDFIKWDLRFIPEKEIAAIFERAYVVVLPYRRIDQSGVLMTALAFGKPIIASRVGGFAEILKDGVHGYLVKAGDVIDLAKALEMILTQSKTAFKMGNKVRGLAGMELSWDKIAQDTVQLYRLLCSKFQMRYPKSNF